MSSLDLRLPASGVVRIFISVVEAARSPVFVTQRELTHRLREHPSILLSAHVLQSLFPAAGVNMNYVQRELRVLSDCHYWVVPAILAKDSGGGPVGSSQSLPPPQAAPLKV